MGSQFRFPRLCLFSLLLVFVASCSLSRELKKSEGERFVEEISRLERLAREDPSASVRSKSHLKLALLYVNCRNPELNYSRALQEMKSYLSIVPSGTQKDDIQNWLAVLREVEHLSKARLSLEEQSQNLQARIDKSQTDLKKVRLKMEEQGQNLQTEIDKLQAGLERIRKANLQLRDEVATLKDTNDKMTETIERLKMIDLQIEERRNLIR